MSFLNSLRNKSDNVKKGIFFSVMLISFFVLTYFLITSFNVRINDNKVSEKESLPSVFDVVLASFQDIFSSKNIKIK